MKVNLVSTFLVAVAILSSFTLVSESFAKPQGGCTPWPDCKNGSGDGGGGKNSSFDFEVYSSSNSITIDQGKTGNVTIIVSEVSGSGNVNLSTLNVPSRVAVTYNPVSGKISPKNPSYSSTMTLDVSSTSNPGLVTLTIQGSGKGITKTTTLDLNIQEVNESPPPPPPPPADPVIVSAGDIACDPQSSSFNGGQGTSTSCHQMHTSDIIESINPNAVLTLGDNQYEDGEFGDFLQSYEPSWGRIKSITYPSPGNHDYHVTGAQGYFDYFGAVAGDTSKGYYSFNIDSWHIISLNSNCADVSCDKNSSQVAWLENDLASNPANCTLAYWHHPRFSSGSGHGNDPRSDAFWRTLYQHNADVILVGHDHNYERFSSQDPDAQPDPTGITQFVVGTGGKNLRSIGTLQPNSVEFNSDTYGVLKLTLHQSSFDWEFVGEPGSSFTDSGTAICN